MWDKHLFVYRFWLDNSQHGCEQFHSLKQWNDCAYILGKQVITFAIFQECWTATQSLLCGLWRSSTEYSNRSEPAKVYLDHAWLFWTSQPLTSIREIISNKIKRWCLWWQTIAKSLKIHKDMKAGSTQLQSKGTGQNMTDCSSRIGFNPNHAENLFYLM